MTVKETRRTPLPLQRKKAQITIGVHGAEGDRPHEPKEGEAASGLTIAQIAAFHEFGTRTIPQRSFIRAWFDENIQENSVLLRSQLQLAAQGKITVEQALERVALKCEASVKKRIRNRIPPPLAAETIRRKGSSVPLIDTGQLRASIRGKAEIL